MDRCPQRALCFWKLYFVAPGQEQREAAANTGCFKPWSFIFFLSLQCLCHVHLYCKRMHALVHFRTPSIEAAGFRESFCGFAATALTSMSQVYLSFTFPFLTNLPNPWLLSDPSVQPGEHHPAAAGEAEQPGEPQEQECHRVREHRADPAAHHAGEERCQQGGLVGE